MVPVRLYLLHIACQILITGFWLPGTSYQILHLIKNNPHCLGSRAGVIDIDTDIDINIDIDIDINIDRL